MLIPFIDMIEPIHSDIVAFCPTVSKTWACAAIRLAAVIAILRGSDPDYIKTIYRAMVRADFPAMPPIAQGLYRSHVNGALQMTDHVDIIARMLHVFDKKKASGSKVLIKDKSIVAAIIRETFSEIVASQSIASEKKATPKGAAKGISPANSTTSRLRANGAA